MPYSCSAGDDQPVVVHLQQLDGDYDQVDFCAEHWVQFIASTAAALGIYDPGDVTGIDPDSPIGLVPAEDVPQPAEAAPEVAEADPVPVGAATDDQRPDADDSAPY